MRRKRRKDVYIYIYKDIAGEKRRWKKGMEESVVKSRFGDCSREALNFRSLSLSIRLRSIFLSVHLYNRWCFAVIAVESAQKIPFR
jgi:hypothetical protein